VLAGREQHDPSVGPVRRVVFGERLNEQDDRSCGDQHVDGAEAIHRFGDDTLRGRGVGEVGLEVGEPRADAAERLDVPA
jgi:hypothetical protein